MTSLHSGLRSEDLAHGLPIDRRIVARKAAVAADEQDGYIFHMIEALTNFVSGCVFGLAWL